jgi:gp16 family phage-associated protein
MEPSEVKARFRDRGKTIRAWARENSFDPALVYAVLAGRILGVRGRAHEVAVALGIKPQPHAEPSSSVTEPERPP